MKGKEREDDILNDKSHRNDRDFAINDEILRDNKIVIRVFLVKGDVTIFGDSIWIGINAFAINGHDHFYYSFNQHILRFVDCWNEIVWNKQNN